MKPFGLDKRHKLCSATVIDALFADRQASSAIAYPLRAVWSGASRRVPTDADFKFMISVPKKRLRRAVDRVTARRRVREAYRLNHREFEEGAHPSAPSDIVFIYIADDVRPYRSINSAMRRLLASIHPSTLSKTQTAVPSND